MKSSSENRKKNTNDHSIPPVSFRELDPQTDEVSKVEYHEEDEYDKNSLSETDISSYV